MYTIVLQGLNHFTGVSTLAAAMTYSLSLQGLKTVCIDADNSRNSVSSSLLFGLERQNYGFLNALKTILLIKTITIYYSNIQKTLISFHLEILLNLYKHLTIVYIQQTL